MAYEQKEATFSMFLNDHKEQEKHPDYRGILKLNGKRYRIAGWFNKTKSGDNYMSGTVRLEEAES